MTDDKVRMLNEISKFCMETSLCRVQSIARHFGEDESNPCGVCDICQNDSVPDLHDCPDKPKNAMNYLASLIPFKDKVI